MAEVKAACEANPKISNRVMEGLLKDMGLKCSHSTISRYKKAKWVPLKNVRAEINKVGTAEAIRDQEHRASVRLDAIEAEEALDKAERKRLLEDVLDDAELTRQAMRESLVAQIILARQISRRAAVLVETEPTALAKLIEALKGPSSTTIVVPPSEKTAPGDGAKIVEGRVVDKSPVASAIEAFKQRQRVAA